MKNIMPFVLLFSVSCVPMETSESISRREQEQNSLQATQAVGMPAITNFAEKRHMKDILELRDHDVPTYTYIVGEGNEKAFLCMSVGYGLPYATQYTNPMKAETTGQGPLAIPQADPNALFMPAGAEATWVLCLDPKTSKLAPVYVEPKIVSSPFPLTF
jgi:hypothetical protein